MTKDEFEVYRDDCDEYLRIQGEDNESFYVIDAGKGEYAVDKYDFDSEPFWVDIISKGSTVLYNEELMAKILEIDIDNYNEMYRLQIDDQIIWAKEYDIIPINY